MGRYNTEEPKLLADLLPPVLRREMEWAQKTVESAYEQGMTLSEYLSGKTDTNGYARGERAFTEQFGNNFK